MLIYIDNILTVGHTESAECAHNLHTIIATCQYLALPLSAVKVEGPTTQIRFLGFEIHSVSMEPKLSQDKVYRLMATVRNWSTMCGCHSSI